jgi:hypothetical protein
LTKTSQRPVPDVARDEGSFRDPSGFVYRREGVLYRQINESYAPHWDRLASAGFLDELVRAGLLIPHELVDVGLAAAPSSHAVIRPTEIDLVTYPYEWTFGELRDAALLTLDIARRALAAGFTMKDASAYNIQFWNGRPVLIDTLSFEEAVPGQPWAAYRQYCEHFLAPLALMALRDVRLGLLQRDFLDGLPLDLAAHLLPARSRLNFGLLSHLVLHARAQARYAGSVTAERRRRPRMSPLQMAALIDNLRSTTMHLKWEPRDTAWESYAENNTYAEEAAADKDRLVRLALQSSAGTVVWDLGANTGRFSQIAAGLGRTVVALDVDHGASERHYRTIKATGESSVLPLVIDVANPSPGLGWRSHERKSLLDRANADVILALALVHHLAIGRNVPLGSISELFAKLAPEAIVEFVPKEDPMVQRLLESRPDVFPDYTLAGFRSALSRSFEILSEHQIQGSLRTILHLRRRTGPTNGLAAGASCRQDGEDDS